MRIVVGTSGYSYIYATQEAADSLAFTGIPYFYPQASRSVSVTLNADGSTSVSGTYDDEVIYSDRYYEFLDEPVPVFSPAAGAPALAAGCGGAQEETAKKPKAAKVDEPFFRVQSIGPLAAAQTGHLVLTTMHTTDVAATATPATNTSASNLTSQKGRIRFRLGASSRSNSRKSCMSSFIVPLRRIGGLPPAAVGVPRSGRPRTTGRPASWRR